MARSGEGRRPPGPHHETAPSRRPQEDAIRRIVAIAVLLASLVGASAAWAKPGSYWVQWRYGDHTSSQAAAGGCSTDETGWGRLLLRCSSSSGQATARYSFTVPSAAGSVASHVYKDPNSHGTLTKQLTRNGTHVTLNVTVKGDDAHVQILSVSIEYYSS
jgi:hypothetical protein